MRVIAYLKNAKLAVAVIVVLLIVQAFADLSLPRYTSDLVDIGIQQGGVEGACPEQMRSRTFDYVCMLSDEGEESLIRSAYDRDPEGVYRLNEAGKGEISSLNEAMALPLVVVHFAESANGSAAASSLGAGQSASSLSLESLYSSYEEGLVSKAEVLSLVGAARSQMGQIDDAIIEQQAVEAVKAEYDALGVDRGALQMGYLVKVGLQMLGVAALMMVVSILVGLIASRVSARIAAELRERLFSKVVSFSDAEVQSFSAASLITRGTNDIQQIQWVIVMFLRMVLYSPILAIGGIVMVMQTNVSMSWIIVLAVVVIAIIVAFLMLVALPKFKVMQKLIDRVNLVSREMLSGLQVVRAFDRQEFEEARFDEASSALYKTQLFTNRAMTFMMPAMMLVMNAVSVLIVWVGGSYIDQGVIQTGDMIAFITYAMVIVMSFLMIGMVSVMLPRASVAAERVDEVIGTECSIADPASEAARHLEVGSTGLPVRFDDVTFAYDADQDPVLSHIDFTARPGQTTAIIGATGSGKTTLLKLIERFYDVTEGAVRVGGVDVCDLPQHELRSMIGYVPQKAFLFSGTVADAVGYGVEDASAEDLRHAMDVAQATEFVDRMRDGVDSEVSQGGTNVSGGQRQRLAIARAVATDAPILLFDDSFSALDYATDAKLRAALAEKAAGKTLVVVAQRISTILDADQIVVLEEGRMVGCGAHDELLRSCPTYREIAESQLSEEELKGGDRR